MEIRKDFTGDLKLPLPPNFSGRYEDFEDWSWTFQTYMGMMEPSLSAYMESVRDMPLEVTDEDLKVEIDAGFLDARIHDFPKKRLVCAVS